MRLAWAAAVGLLAGAGSAPAQQRVFDIRAVPANRAIPEFARQAGVQIVAPGREIRAVRVTPVRGSLDIAAALETMLRGTGLRVLMRSASTITLGYTPPSPALQRSAVFETHGRARAAALPAATPSSAAPLLAIETLATLQDIIVTGSRIASSGYSSPTPLSVVMAEDVRRRAPLSIGSVLQETPSFRPSQNPSAARSFTNNGYYADMRGLGANRTLVLVDGRRFVPTSAMGTVDLNMIPAILVDRTEIVTGGASAAWGSDAVAGVVNFIIKPNIDGLIGEAQTGIADAGDGFTYKIAMAGGTGFAQSRGRLVAGIERTFDRGIGDNYTRDWGREEWWFLQNPNFALNGLPATIWTKNVHYSSQTPGGLIATGPLRGTAFTADGTPYPFAFGEVLGDDQVGGDNYGVSSWTGVNIRQPADRTAAMARATFEAGQATWFAEGNFTRIDWSVRSFGTRNFGTQSPSSSPFAPIVIMTDNPFIPAATRAVLDSLLVPVTSFQLGRFGTDNFQQVTSKTNETARGVIGGAGEVGAIRWSANALYGQNIFTRTVVGQRVEAAWRRATDVTTVIRDGVAVPICRDLLSADPATRAAAAGCVPYNVFGTQPASDAARAYVTGLSRQRQRTTQTAASLGMQATPAELPAGPVRIAAGLEYRRETLRNRASPLEQARAFSSANSPNADGRFDVRELYFETLAPLLRDRPLAQALDVNAAVRLARYSTSGRVVTWKIGANWTLGDGIRLRATRSRDMRAPNLTELFSPAAETNARVIDPLRSTAYTVRTISTGNPRLAVERADTLTAGLVIQPKFASGLQASIDTYSIDIRDVITTSVAQAILDSCVSGRADLCGLVLRSPGSGNIVEIDTPYLNLNRFRTKGVDFELSYRLPLGAGQISARLLGTYVWDFTLTDINGSIDRSGQNPTPVTGATTGIASLLLNGTLAYESDAFGLSVQARHVSSGAINRAAVAGTPTGLNINRIPSRTYFNLGGRLALVGGRGGARSAELFFAVDNVLNKAPPYPSFDGIYYDLVGRAYRAGIRFKY